MLSKTRHTAAVTAWSLLGFGTYQFQISGAQWFYIVPAYVAFFVLGYFVPRWPRRIVARFARS